MKYDAFISYARVDKPRIVKTVSELRSRGLNIWIDEEGIDGASVWRGEIVHAIQNSESVIFFASQSSCQSEAVEKELTIASEEKKTILPVLIEKVKFPTRIRYQLTGLHFIDGSADPPIVAEKILRVCSPAAGDTISNSNPAIPKKRVRSFPIVAAMAVLAIMLLSTFWIASQSGGFPRNADATHAGNTPGSTGPTVLKRALVIGNNDYLEAIGLKNAINDAKAMTALLEKNGFEVTELLNVHSKLFMTRVRSHYARFDVTRGIKVDKKVGDGDPSTRESMTVNKPPAKGVNVVFYTGHAIEVNGEVFLMLVDHNPASAADVMAAGIRLSDLLPETYGVTPSDSFFLYSSEPGGMAMDGQGSNSPFTAALLAELARDESTLVTAFTAVRKAVQENTDGRQIPWMNLSGDTGFSLQRVDAHSGIASVVILDACRDNPFPSGR